MRITNNTMSRNFLNGYNKSLEQQNKLQEQLSDYKALHRPSDDPVKTVRSLQYSTNLATNEQYSQNLQDAQSWMSTTDDAMQSLSSIMISIKEQVIQASNGTNPQSAVQAIGASVDNLINQVVSIGNSKIGDRYIFAGQNVKTMPVVRDGDSIIYQGDSNKISMPIQPGIVNPSQDGVNLTGLDAFGTDMTTLNDLIAIKQHLQSGTPADQAWLSSTGLAALDADHSQMLQANTALGSRMSMYNMAQNMLDSSNIIIQQGQSTNDNIDVAKTITNYKNAENVYKTALQIGAQMMPVSLADFLK